MNKIAFFLLILPLLLSCSKTDYRKTNPLKLAPTSKIVKTVTIYGNPETGIIFNTYYNSQFHEKNAFQNCFFSRLDSVHRKFRNVIHRNNVDFTTQIQSFCLLNTNDTLFINYKADPPTNEHDHLKYVCIDSIDIPLKKGPFRVYCFSNLDEDERWDETLYFSKELGQIYSHYPFFKKKYELIEHSSIGASQLSIITDHLKKLSGEMAE